MEPTATDPLATMLLTGGGSAGTMGLLMYLFMNKFKNGNNNVSTDSGMKEVCHKLDQTNELLNELLRSQARTEGLLQNLNHRG
tara:strand:- start:712 stop:960 length:249 start_codon:yes stop_codon:yes gene_type:complete